jgi:hypothetical protein
MGMLGWIGVIWAVCALIYWGPALRKYEASPHATAREKEKASLKFWARIAFSPFLIIAGKW